METPTEYLKEKKTINLVTANLFGLILLLVVGVLYIVPYYLIWLQDLSPREMFASFSENHTLWKALLILPVLIIGIVLHELIHGVVWATYANNGFRSIKFGVLWEMLTPYCHCKEPLTVKQYTCGAIMPCVVLGIVPAILALILGDFYLLLFAIFFTAAASGDIMIIHLLRKEKRGSLVLDHPSEPGYYIYRAKDADEETV